ncbi:hypothetical protein AOQ84DRAFT_366468 [Glonium stellatum]|uniref:Uncharacterized protein n=1 Tax=Glonium stellatum TaxID=574774 RepID=A0A8E2EVP4_9PEZI|nr:hypothetical protein AOQ84DRAFT_366468 [Glonium stellatum]
MNSKSNKISKQSATEPGGMRTRLRTRVALDSTQNTQKPNIDSRARTGRTANKSSKGPAKVGVTKSGEILEDTNAKPDEIADASKPKSPVPTIWRVNTTALKIQLQELIREDWSKYQDAITKFLMGCATQEELSELIDPIIHADELRRRLHNQLVAAILHNAHMAPPRPEENICEEDLEDVMMVDDGF